ncbi:MAG TPA: ribosome recycling factor [Dehalococcoidia bacterium]|nr:ribosome recycling factor [Dehalococcoidia bacterium]
MSVEEVFKNTEIKMRKAVSVLKDDLASIRTGRASSGLVDHIRVDYHGVSVPLEQIASVAVPDVRMIVIQPWEKDILPNIEKAILKSELGLTPASDGNVIRLSLPQLTEERRNELVKMVRKRVEDGKVAVRNVRREGLEKLRDLKESKEISEDEQKRALGHLQQLTDKSTEEIDQIAKGKETELLEF